MNRSLHQRLQQRQKFLPQSLIGAAKPVAADGTPAANCSNQFASIKSGTNEMVDRLCHQVGVSKQMSPHRIRHSSITTALNVSGGDIRKVQKLSRHSKIETVLIYDDNRAKDQLELSHQLADLV